MIFVGMGLMLSYEKKMSFIFRYNSTQRIRITYFFAIGTMHADAAGPNGTAKPTYTRPLRTGPGRQRSGRVSHFFDWLFSFLFFFLILQVSNVSGGN